MIGKSILHYKIIEKLGEGGMGIVYKAEDSKLNRLVAIKVLPPHLLISPDDKARFHREAKAAAALNHSNIAMVYEINESEEKPFIVMEYVEGQTLEKIVGAENLLPLQDAISIIIQIADGLAAAHKKEVVHRDIKASNILYSADKKAKILDFGLAKTSMSTKLTQMGTTIGTVAYMSPEQVQGKEVDHRTDLWSLGVLLYEMIAGHLPFKAEYDQAIFYTIQNENPDPLTAIRSGVPMSLEWIVNKLMAKDPEERYQSANDLIIDLKAVNLQTTGMSRISGSNSINIQASPTKKQSLAYQFQKKSPNLYLIITSIILAFLFGLLISLLFTNKTELQPAIRASVNLPGHLRYLDDLGGNSAISPDGKFLAFSAVDSASKSNLWVLNLSKNESTLLDGTGKASYPFWSPDGRSIAFFSDGEMRKVSVNGGPVVSLATAPFGRGGAWSKNGNIVFSPAVIDHNLYSVSAAGGKVELLTQFDSTSTYWPRFPCILPDGEHFLFTLLEMEATNKSDVYIGSFNNPETKKILNDAAYAMYSSGYLFFLRQGILMMQSFDADNFSFIGDPVSLVGNINRWEPRAKADFSVSNNGILIYAGSLISQKAQLTWLSSDGSETALSDIQSPIDVPRISPSGYTIAYSEAGDLWLYNLNSKSKSRLTFSGPGFRSPVWSHDGNLIFYNADISGNKTNILAKRADGVGNAELITHDEKSVMYNPEDVSHNGRYLLLIETTGFGEVGDISFIDLYEKQRPIPVKKMGINGSKVRFSPNDEWIVFFSGKSNIENIFIQPFNNKIGKWQVTEDAADDPLWIKDQIIYWSGNEERWERIKITFKSDIPIFSSSEPLFKDGLKQTRLIFDGTRAGDNFLCMQLSNSQAGNSLSAIINWKSLIEKD